jgi:membrane-associated protease RseP (regulator of RpoE activity)
MLRTPLFVLAGLAVGFAAASALERWQRPLVSPVSELGTGPAESTRLSAGPRDARLDAIEAEIKQARREREDLKTTLAAFGKQLAASASRASTAPPDSRVPASPPEERERSERIAQQPTGERTAADALAQRVAELTAGGFAPDRAEWIAEREAELRMTALYSRYEAERQGEPPNPRGFFTSQDTLRTELGDGDYERYLAASGRPTNVPVSQVLANSPAATAGLEPGDRIVAYGGQRVFDMRELNGLTLKGTPGEPVALDVLRDGAQIQLFVPRGPIGIFQGGRRGP